MSDDMSKEDWQRKDKLNSRMSAMKAVGMAYEGSYESVNAEDLIKEANKIYGWVTQDQTWADCVSDKPQEVKTDKHCLSDTSHPTPTVDQQKALDKVKEETDWTVSQVWARFGKFPSTNNVDTCIKKIRS